MRRALLVSSLALTAALVPATSAFAYGEGDFYTRFGVAKVAPQSDNGDFGAPLDMQIDADDDSGFASHVSNPVAQVHARRPCRQHVGGASAPTLAPSAW